MVVDVPSSTSTVLRLFGEGRSLDSIVSPTSGLFSTSLFVIKLFPHPHTRSSIAQCEYNIIDVVITTSAAGPPGYDLEV